MVSFEPVEVCEVTKPWDGISMSFEVHEVTKSWAGISGVRWGEWGDKALGSYHGTVEALRLWKLQVPCIEEVYKQIMSHFAIMFGKF